MFKPAKEFRPGALLTQTGRGLKGASRAGMCAGALHLCRSIAAAADQGDRGLIGGPELHGKADALASVLGLEHTKVQVRAAGKAGVP